MFFDASKRNVSLRGNSKKEDRTTHLERLERERKERDLARLRLKSAGSIQAAWRSHRERRMVKNVARIEWDAKISSESVDLLWAVRVFNFFYQPNIDAQRLERFASLLLSNQGNFRLPDASALSALYFSKLIYRLQAFVPTAGTPNALVLLDLFTSDEWLSSHAPFPRPKIDAIFKAMMQRNLFANLQSVLQNATTYDVDHRGKAVDIAARMLVYPSAFTRLVNHLLILPHFPLAIPRATLTNLLARLASVPVESQRVSVPKDSLVLLDNIILLCAPVIDSAPNSLGTFVALMHAVITELLPPVPLSLPKANDDSDEDVPVEPPATLPLPLRERLVGFMSGGALRSVFLAASSAALTRSPPQLSASSGAGGVSLQVLLPPLFFHVTRLLAALKAWEPFEHALVGVSKITLSSSQLAPMWTLIQQCYELRELQSLDPSLAPEVLAVFELFFSSYCIVVSDTDDDDFMANVPITVEAAKTMFSILRGVVIKSLATSGLSSAWQSLLASILPVTWELYDRSLRRPYLEGVPIQLSGQELANAVFQLESNDTYTIRVIKHAFFLFPLENRINYFQRLLHASRDVHQDDHRGLEVTIQRKYLFEDALKRLQNIDLRKVLRIVFVSLDGSTEVGHGGGLTKEFLHLFATTAFNPQFGLFLANEQHRLYPNPASHIISPNHLEMFTLMGKMLGKMLYDGVPTYIPLTEIAYGVLTGRKTHFDDLMHLDPTFYRSLLKLKQQQHGIEALDLNFTITTSEFSTVSTKELKPHGQNIPVTDANKNEYIKLTARFKLVTQCEQQYAALKRGFHQLIPEEWVAMFAPAELAALLNGNSDNSKPIDLDDLRKHTNYTNGYDEDHPTIQFFWQVVAAFTPQQQHKLLQFVTGTDSVPLLGFSQLEPRFCIQLSHVDRDSDEANSDLPTASTCMNLLKLNPFLDPVLMREKLLYAIENCVGFELS